MNKLHFLQKLGITGLTTAGITGGGMGSSFTPAQAMSLLHTSTGQVGTIEPSTGVFTSLANGPTLTDIALTETNELFGVSFGQLYKVDTNTNSFSLIGNLGVGNMNGLGFEREGNLYGTGGNGFYQIDTATGRANLVSNLSGFSSAGDIVFNPETNQFLGTSISPLNSTLFSIGLDGTTVEVGSIGFGDVFGLFFEKGNLFGYTANGQQISMDLGTGAGTFDDNVTGVSGQIFGAASLPSTGPGTKTPEPASRLGLLIISAMGGGSWLKQKKQRKTSK